LEYNVADSISRLADAN